MMLSDCFQNFGVFINFHVRSTNFARVLQVSLQNVTLRESCEISSLKFEYVKLFKNLVGYTPSKTAK